MHKGYQPHGGRSGHGDCWSPRGRAARAFGQGPNPSGGGRDGRWTATIPRSATSAEGVPRRSRKAVRLISQPANNSGYRPAMVTSSADTSRTRRRSQRGLERDRIDLVAEGIRRAYLVRCRRQARRRLVGHHRRLDRIEGPGIPGGQDVRQQADRHPGRRTVIPRDLQQNRDLAGIRTVPGGDRSK